MRKRRRCDNGECQTLDQPGDVLVRQPALSARLPSRKTRRNTPCPSFTPAPAATTQPPAPSRPIRGQRSDIRLSGVFAPPADGRVDDRDHVPRGHRCALTRQVAGLILEPVHRHFASSISDARFTRFSDDMNSTVIAEGLSSTDLRTPHHDRTAATPESRKSQKSNGKSFLRKRVVSRR